MPSLPTSPQPDSISRSGTPRRLLLMRHAKSDWSGNPPSDHDRTLNDRGLRDALAMARWIAEAGWHPDCILCSSATRTQQTAALMQSYWKSIKLEMAPVHILSELYLAPADTILEIVRSDFTTGADRAVDPPRTMLVLAHNPGLSHAASSLLGHATGMSTAAVVALRCDVANWKTPLTADNTACVAEMKPKAIGRDDRIAP